MTDIGKRGPVLSSDSSAPPPGVSRAAWEIMEAERRHERMLDALDHRMAEISAERWAVPPPEPSRAAELDEELKRLRARRRTILAGEAEA
jgi:hypothetical protein